MCVKKTNDLYIITVYIITEIVEQIPAHEQFPARETYESNLLNSERAHLQFHYMKLLVGVFRVEMFSNNNYVQICYFVVTNLDLTNFYFGG